MESVYKNGKELVKEIHDTDLPYGTVAVWSLGQSGILLKGSRKDGWLAIDPYLTYAIEENDPKTEFKRVFPPPISPEGLKGASGVLVTHFHDDHLDPLTIERVAAVSPATRLAVPASHLSVLNESQVDFEAVIPAKSGQPFATGGFQVMPIAVAHDRYEKDQEGNHFYLGYFITANGVKLFHSGDAVVDAHLVEKVGRFRPHIAFLPINGGDYARAARGIIGNMTFREACDFGVQAGADIIIPVHYDMFPNNRDNPAYFVDYLFHTYPSQKFHMMAPGERFIYGL